MPLLRRELTTVWIALDAVEMMLAETVSALPVETGGMLIGYWTTPGREAVVFDLIGPGPNAVHARTGFLPDGEWQQTQLEETYCSSGRVHTYIGDWHSHPFGDASPSPRDRRTARVVASERMARAPHPITVIVAVSESIQLSAFVRRRRRLAQAAVRMYSL